MEYSLLDVVNNLKNKKRILVNYGFNFSNPYVKYIKSNALFLPQIMKDNIEKTIFSNISKRKNEIVEKILFRYEKLIILECCTFEGLYTNRNSDKDVEKFFIAAKQAYAKILKEIKSFKLNQRVRFDDLFIDKVSGKKISDSFNPDNLDKINDLFNEIISKTPKSKDLGEFNYIKALFSYLEIKNHNIHFIADDKFGMNAYFDFANNSEIISDIENLKKIMLLEANKLKLIIEIFKDFPNVSLKVDECQVKFSELSDEMIEDIINSVHDNTLKLIIEMMGIAKENLINNEEGYKFFNEIINPEHDKSEESEDAKCDAKTESDKNSNKTCDSVDKRIEQEFSNIVGLKKVKQEIIDMVNYCNKLKSVNKFSLKDSHMCFLGNPGTGKTTIARILAKILHEEGYLKNDKVKEVGGVELKASYMGQTSELVLKTIKESEGGILFIDEAYQLVDASRSDDTFGKEVLATLVKQMEDNSNLMVVFAGYGEETRNVIKYNKGLESRVGTVLEFEDYSVEELIDIAKVIAKSNNYTLTEDAISVVKEEVQKHIREKNFGNGRFIRNLIGKAEKIQTRRAAKDNFEIIGEDVKLAVETYKPKQTQKFIGFSNS